MRKICKFFHTHKAREENILRFLEATFLLPSNMEPLLFLMFKLYLWVVLFNDKTNFVLRSTSTFSRKANVWKMSPGCYIVGIEEHGNKGPEDELKKSVGVASKIKEVTCTTSRNPTLRSFCLHHFVTLKSPLWARVAQLVWTDLWVLCFILSFVHSNQNVIVPLKQ